MQFGCAAMPVPLDYTHPDGPTIDLAVVRIHTTQNTPRRSVDAGQPGRPGRSGLELRPRAAGQISPAVVRHFDIIAFDPRGVGAVDADQLPDRRAEGRVPRRVADTLTAGGHRGTKAASTGSSRTTAPARVGPTLQYYNTVNTARDMDQIRQARRRRRHELPRLLLRHRTRLDVCAPVPARGARVRARRRGRPVPRSTTRTRSPSWRASRTRSASSRSGARRRRRALDLHNPARPLSRCSRARCTAPLADADLPQAHVLTRRHRGARGAVLEE